jgi:uncharacterized membrane protein/chitodextrinase
MDYSRLSGFAQHFQGRRRIGPLKACAIVLVTCLAGCGGGGGDSRGDQPGSPNPGDVPGTGTAVPDTTPPATPAGLSATSSTPTAIDLAWNAATDDKEVTGYKVYRAETAIATVTATSYRDASLSSATQYCYVVTATDAASNESAPSAQACATTAVPPDTTAPTLISTTPKNNDADIHLGATITAEFSEALSAATLNTSTFTVSDANKNTVSGAVTYSGTTATFSPNEILAPMETYTATLATGIQDLAGNALSTQTWTFKTGLPSFQLTAIGEDPPSAEDDLFTLLNDLNEKGEVAGEAVRTRAVNGQAVQESIAFLWRDGNLIDLGALNPLVKDSRSQGINDGSEVAGWSYPGDTGTPAFIARQGTIAPIGLEDAFAINNAGQIVGFLTRVQNDEVVSVAVIWQAGQLTDLPGLANPWNINQAGDVVGFSYVDDFPQATLWKNGLATPLGMLTGALSSDAFDTNASGQIAGVSYFAPPASTTTYERAVLWQSSSMIELTRSANAHESSTAYGLNDRGDVVGRSGTVGYRAVLWLKQSVHDLNDLIAADDPLKSYVTLVEAREINNRGQIIVQGADSRRQGSYSGYLLTPR